MPFLADGAAFASWSTAGLLAPFDLLVLALGLLQQARTRSAQVDFLFHDCLPKLQGHNGNRQLDAPALATDIEIRYS